MLFTQSSVLSTQSFYFTFTVSSRLPQGEVKVTRKVPVLALMEVTVKRAPLPSSGLRGSARMAMSAQFVIEGSMRGGVRPV